MRPSRKALTVLTAVLGAILAVLLAAALILSCMKTGDGAETTPQSPDLPAQESEEPGSSVGEPETTQPRMEEMAFPCYLESGKLEVVSLFPFSGFNPDCGGREGTDIAGIQVTNLSGAHLTEATITMILSSGNQTRFSIRDLPAGMTALAFSDENVSMDAEDTCVFLSCEASFEEKSPLMADRLTVSVEGTRITVTNISGDDLTGLIVYCHCLLDRDSFGGSTYSYPIDSLPAGGSATVDAWDCLLGAAEVVRIGMADQ